MFPKIPPWWLALAALAPVCWIAVLFSADGLARGWLGGAVLAVTALALGAGVIVAAALGREVTRAVGELASEAGIVARGPAVARLERAANEFAAIADTLQAAAQRATSEPDAAA